MTRPARRRVHPRTWRRSTIVALALAAVGGVGLVLSIVFLVNALRDIPRRIDARPRVPVPGEATLTLPAGERGIWLEVTAPSRPDISNIGVTITPADGTEPLIVRFPTSVQNYDLEGRRGALIGTVAVPDRGEYLVTVQGRGGDNVSIGATTATEDLINATPIFISGAVAAVCFLGAFVVPIGAAFRRRRRSAEGAAP